MIHSFYEKGVIRLEKWDRGGQPISYDRIEEIAIEAEAEEVVLDDPAEQSEVLEARVKSEEAPAAGEAGEEPEPACWTLRTDPAELYKVKGYLEKQHPQLVLREFHSEYIPMHRIELADQQLEEFQQLYSVLEEHEEIDNIYMNVA